MQVDRSRKHEEELKRTVAAAAKQESAAKTLAAKVEALEAELKAVRGESEMSSREAKAAEARLAEAERVRADALEQLRQRVRDQLSDKETECAELRAEVRYFFFCIVTPSVTRVTMVEDIKTERQS